MEDIRQINENFTSNICYLLLIYGIVQFGPITGLPTVDLSNMFSRIVSCFIPGEQIVYMEGTILNRIVETDALSDSSERITNP